MGATITIVVCGALQRSDLPALMQRTGELLEQADVELLCCEVDGLVADAVAIDALARLALLARRRDCQLRLSGASRDLRVLIAFTGLADVLR